jgi:hypothetical protein
MAGYIIHQDEHTVTTADVNASAFREMVLWVQHVNSTWGWRNKTASEPTPMKNVIISIDLSAGGEAREDREYDATWYSTWPLGVLGVAKHTAVAGNLTLRVPLGLTNDTVVIIHPVAPA